ncbi:hemerythrin domain-containing protein [Nonomuraea terrae]|uniref:Hemerythrin domain-containing protein n=1 Tax=Nonomuraea terrae TaxID=2530383 RepID=A0A4R4ZER1_9ACTN|nr:hemerythrin domain-containing protein [Nonomuraea terrae]TDD56450.1 hemerythrin domain-containing protein [Nonomuraea terrae]
MREGEHDRLIAWDHELKVAHGRLREALRLARDSLDRGDGAFPRDLLLYCHGFCAALGGHHVSEDTGLFPELAARHPGLRPVIAKLEQDHGMIAWLLQQFKQALDAAAPANELLFHLDGLSAIMESHFRYEERRLLGTLATLDLDAEPGDLLGPP